MSWHGDVFWLKIADTDLAVEGYVDVGLHSWTAVLRTAVPYDGPLEGPVILVPRDGSNVVGQARVVGVSTRANARGIEHVVTITSAGSAWWGEPTKA